MFQSVTPEFRAEFEQWRGERSQWKALVKAVRADAPCPEMDQLAAEAGVTAVELKEMQMIRRHAKEKAAEATKYPSVKKRLAELDREIERLTKLVEKATADEHPALIHKLAAAAEMRGRHFRGDYIGPEQAAKYIEEIARPLGLA